MNKTSKRAVLALAGVSCASLLMGCETLVFADESYSQAAEANTRARVLAELREAKRLGLITVGEEDIPSPTREQSRMIAQAGDDAAVAEARPRK
ncbi:MAG: DUF4148 domain-containing protein [Burkholderiaceae bacterium]